LHARFLHDPAPTDVISFELGDDGGPEAEIYVSVDRARVVAKERGVAVREELLLYLVHGSLHLCGLDDRTPLQCRRMRAAEAAVLASLGVVLKCADDDSVRTGETVPYPKTKKTSRR
jgi:probable rRNA maturation factor